MADVTRDAQAGRFGFEDSEGLRALLARLHRGGPGSWRADPEAAALMAYVAARYAALARKHGLDPWEAAAAAFDAMRTPAVRQARDPWAVVTHAVRITCVAEERAQGLLCSVHRARRPQYSVFHDPERFSDREDPLPDYHPAFHTPPADHNLVDDDPDGDGPGVGPSVQTAVGAAVRFLSLLGWPADTARAAVDYVCGRLAQAPTRAAAFEMLRRDRAARAFLDVPATSWTGLLRLLLGSPDPNLAHTAAGRGLLVRLLVGEPLPALLADEDLVWTASLTAPVGGHPGGEGR